MYFHHFHHQQCDIVHTYMCTFIVEYISLEEQLHAYFVCLLSYFTHLAQYLNPGFVKFHFS